MFRACIIMFLAKLVFAVPATLVPRISTENGYNLVPQNNQYTLSIRHPDDKTWREETVKEIAPGQLEVKGILNQAFDDVDGSLIVIYEAGPNGYVAKYIYKTNAKKEPQFEIFLSSGLLKSSAG